MVAKVGVWIGRLVSVAALGCWSGWLAWRVSTPLHGPVGAMVLALELMAFVAGLVVTAGLWCARPGGSTFQRSANRPIPTPVLMADALGLDRSLVSLADRRDVGEDDTGEIAWAKRGLGVLGGDRRSGTSAGALIRETAWSVVSTDGLRRMLAVIAVIVVLFSGRAPFDQPPPNAVGLLVAGVVGLSLGTWMMSRGRILPARRFVWSMASVGAGVGDGRSRSGLPIRWVTTMATMVALNLAVALRGLSDRWTHGLGPMAHDARVIAMSVALSFVVAGLVGLRWLPHPDLGFYGATKRIEETSARRMALGGTMAVALLGFVLGVLPPEPA